MVVRTEEATPRSLDAPISCSSGPSTPAKEAHFSSLVSTEKGEGFITEQMDDVTRNHSRNFDVRGVANDGNMTFTELLARAEEGKSTDQLGNAVSTIDVEDRSHDYAPCFQPRIGVSFVGDSDGFIGAERDKIQRILMDGSSRSSRPFFDLNMVPTANESFGFHFEPITPEKSSTTSLSAAEHITISEFSTAKHAQAIVDKAKNNLKARQEKEQTHRSVDQLHASVSTQLQENHKPDKGCIEEAADLSQTPQKRPKRSRPKHRPKVITEGKPRTKRKQNAGTTTPLKRTQGRGKPNVCPNTPIEDESNGIYSSSKTPPSSVDTQVAKKVYTRRKKSDKLEDMGMDKGTPKTADVNTLSRGTSNPRRRSLNFDFEGEMTDENPTARQSLGRCSLEMENVQTQSGITIANDNCQCSRRKCQIPFSDVSQDKETNSIRATTNHDHHLSANGLTSSTDDSIRCFAAEGEARGLKRQHADAPIEAEFCLRNMTEVCHNLQQADAGSFHRNSGWYGFPAIHKKKRTEIVRRNSLRDRFFSTKIVRQKRTKAPTRLRDLASLIEIGKGAANHAGASAATFRVEHKLESLQETHTCLEVAVACNNFTSSTLKTKKRSRRSVIRNTSVQNFDLATQPRGPPLAITWKSLSPIDSITEQLSELNLNTQISEASSRNLSMAYRSLYQEQRALVPYQSHGAIVPLDGSFHQINRQPRAKVDLDDETTRVWNLLLENINSEGIDGTDEEKRKWWEAERRVFKGRADSFIARMHLVQGDRRFSPWKGSVADSVVGVFLTQNVTDHLSSSAFMSLVAKFPPKSKKQPEGGIEVQNNSPSVEETMLQELGDDDVRKLGGNKSPGSSTDGSIPRPHESTVQSPDTFEHVPVVSRESGTNKSSPIEDGKDKEDGLLSQTLEISSQGSANSPTAHTAEISESRLRSTSQEPTAWTKSNGFTGSTVSVHALQVAGTVQHDVPEKEANGEKNRQVQCGSLGHNLQNEQNLVNILSHEKLTPLDGECSLCLSPNLDTLETADLSQESVKGLSPSNIENGTCGAATLLSESASQMTTSSLEEDSDALEPAELSQERAGLLSHSSIENETCVAEALGLLSESASHVTTASRKEGPQFHASIGVEDEMHKMVGDRAGHASAENFLVENHSEMQEVSDVPSCSQNSKAIMESCIEANNVKMSECKEVSSNKNDVDYNPREKDGNKKGKEAKTSKRENTVDWDRLRDHAKAGGRQREKTPNTMDSVDWDAVRCADVKEVAEAIKERGMNNVLAGRIQDFLNRIVKDHGSIDLEWLRDVPPDRAKEYLLSVRGLGLKSVECVRLLTLHHLAFPVDTNVGRIAVRLGWVPLQPLPESLQLHLLELYPLLETIQKYLWPRLCKLDQKTLYELHYQMITFGKVFCTKSKPNCNACPMRGECRHFASAFASARLSLPAPDEKSMVTTTTTADDKLADQDLQRSINPLQLPSIQTDVEFTVSNYQPIVEGPPSPQPVIEVPPSPPPVVEVPPSPEFVTEICGDIEDFCNEDSDEIPTIRLNMTEFTHNLKKIMQQTAELQEGDMSKALVALTAEAASIPAPKLKSVSRLRTEHQVYVLPDSHPLLEGLDVREPDDPSPYLLSIWTPGETINSTEPPKRQCTSQESEKLCNNETCSSCNSIREAISDTVRGTLLIPCRTAMRGSFPLNGTYFQVNEVFADHESSLSPMEIPRQWLWKLPRRPVYFGTSVTSIFRGLSTEGIQYCFWRGFVCVRGFERKTRAPRPLIARLHFPASKLNKGKGKTDEN